MKRLRLTAFIMILCLLPGLSGGAALAEAVSAPELSSAECAIIGDMGTGRILYNMNAYSRHAPASLTKIMTLLLAVEAIELGKVSENDMVTAESDCKTAFEDDSSSVGIHMGETMSLRDLLYCAALASANEACNIIASHVSGSIERFVAAMNARADELGCSGTHFTNTHGMPDAEHYSTARDLFVISVEAMRHPLFASIVGTAEYTTAPTNASPARLLKNSNALLNKDSVYSGKYAYDGAVGIKTGRTEAAGYCLVGAVQRDGVNVISVVLGAKGDAVSKSFDSFGDTVRLFDWCFDNYSYRTLVEKGTEITKQKLNIGGTQGEISLVCESAVNALAPKSLDPAALERTVSLNSETLTRAPEEGEVLGTVSYTDSSDGTVYGTVKLVASGTADVVIEDKPTENTPELGSDQKLAIVIVCALFVLTVLIFALLIARKQRARRQRRAAERAAARRGEKR